VQACLVARGPAAALPSHATHGHSPFHLLPARCQAFHTSRAPERQPSLRPHIPRPRFGPLRGCTAPLRRTRPAEGLGSAPTLLPFGGGLRTTQYPKSLPRLCPPPCAGAQAGSRPIHSHSKRSERSRVTRPTTTTSACTAGLGTRAIMHETFGISVDPPLCKFFSTQPLPPRRPGWTQPANAVARFAAPDPSQRGFSLEHRNDCAASPSLAGVISFLKTPGPPQNIRDGTAGMQKQRRNTHKCKEERTEAL